MSQRVPVQPVRALCILALLWGSVWACSDSMAPSRAASDSAALSVSSATATISIPVPALNSPEYGAVAPIGTGLSVATGEYFRLRVAAPGEISATYSGMCSGVVDRPAFTAAPNGIPNGNQQGLAVKGYVGGKEFGAFERDADGSWVSIASPTQAGGALSIGRTGYVDYCDSDQKPTYALSGSQSVHIDFVGVMVSPSASTVYEGASVFYTATPVNFDAASVRGVAWSLIVDSTGNWERIVACEGQLTCAYTPTTSGTIVASLETIGGVVDGRSPLTLIKCPVRDSRDSLLNNPQVRATLRALANASGTFTKPAGERREMAGVISRDTVTGELHFTAATVASSTPCSFNGSFSRPLGDKLVALYHSHPFKPATGGSPAEVFPSECGDLAGQSYDPRPSENADWPYAVQYKVPYYYIDAQKVGVADGSDTVAQQNHAKWRSLARKYSWNTQSCRW